MDVQNLSDIGFEDAAKAQLLLLGLPGNGVSTADIDAFLPLLLTALRESPDPDRALNAFVRWFAAIEEPRTFLPVLRELGVLNRFCFVTGCSQYFADLLARYPDDFAIPARPAQYDVRETPARRYHEISRLTEGCDTLDEQRDVLRRWKAREMLQIGVRDLLGLDDMPTTAREFSNLADACVQMALDIAYSSLAVAPLPFAIFALGKLGGQELNYSSDIDLIFVHGDGLPSLIVPEDRKYGDRNWEDGKWLETAVYLARLAETIISVLADDSAYGHVFRVDMRLRPEGRFGHSRARSQLTVPTTRNGPKTGSGRCCSKPGS